ncbi:hypothetical protein [Rhizobium binxianense]|uniref:hypothetical protein n=1 Tax=Rhizobium binxianense TaxID=3024242 RepID=UPI0023A99976|nr:hypothetical protein [Rhizobium sp. MJ22]WEA28096.1 hypothetical protein PO862_06115 [Rhizobium sp. MJ22]
MYRGYPDWFAVIVFFLPMPFNIFIWSAVWRASVAAGRWRFDSGDYRKFARLLGRGEVKKHFNGR